MNDIPPATQEDEDDEDDEGEDAFEEMEDVTVSEAGNTEDYDAKHVNFRYTSTIYIQLGLLNLKSEFLRFFSY